MTTSNEQVSKSETTSNLINSVSNIRDFFLEQFIIVHIGGVIMLLLFMTISSSFKDLFINYYITPIFAGFSGFCFIVLNRYIQSKDINNSTSSLDIQFHSVIMLTGLCIISFIVIFLEVFVLNNPIKFAEIMTTISGIRIQYLLTLILTAFTTGYIVGDWNSNQLWFPFTSAISLSLILFSCGWLLLFI